jgi:hypothetical protein
MPAENSGTRSRSGGMSVSLASPDGRVVGGGVAGLLVAASPVQVRLLAHMEILIPISFIFSTDLHGLLGAHQSIGSFHLYLTF